MKVKEKSIKLILICFVISILLLSGCTEEKKTSNNNGESPGDESLIVPMPDDLTEFKQEYDSFWSDLDFESSFDKTLYISNSSVKNIISWYLETYAFKYWYLVKTYETALDFDSPYEVTLAEAKLLNTNSSLGAYILVKKVNDSIPSDAVSLIGIAIGPWNLIINNGYTKDMSYYEFGYYAFLEEGPIEFDKIPLNETAYEFIRALGDLDPNLGNTFPMSYGAFYLKNSEGNTPIDNVYAPADGAIISTTYNNESGYDDYNLTIAHTNTFWSYIEHLSEIDESIISETGELEYGKNDFSIDPIIISSGQIIGKTGGTDSGQKFLNWRILDQDKILNYANPDRYDKYIHSAHFIEYYEQGLQKTLLEKIGSGSPNYYTRTKEPLWGKADYYEDSTIIGNWFLYGIDENSPLTEYNKHLSFVYDIWDPSQIRIAVGGTLNITATVYRVENNSPDLRDIAVGDTVVYHLRGTEERGETGITATLLLFYNMEGYLLVEGFQGHNYDLTFKDFTQDSAMFIR